MEHWLLHMMALKQCQLDWGDLMSKEMAFLNIGADSFEVVDEAARNGLTSKADKNTTGA